MLSHDGRASSVDFSIAWKMSCVGAGCNIFGGVVATKKGGKK
jgi:hypothetical protein